MTHQSGFTRCNKHTTLQGILRDRPLCMCEGSGYERSFFLLFNYARNLGVHGKISSIFQNGTTLTSNWIYIKMPTVSLCLSPSVDSLKSSLSVVFRLMCSKMLFLKHLLSTATTNFLKPWLDIFNNLEYVYTFPLLIIPALSSFLLFSY